MVEDEEEENVWEIVEIGVFSLLNVFDLWTVSHIFNNDIKCSNS